MIIRLLMKETFIETFCEFFFIKEQYEKKIDAKLQNKS